MKRKVFLMLAVAMFALAACVKENNGNKIAPEGEAWMALTINTPAQTRAINDPAADYGTADETKVSNVVILLFNNGGTCVHKEEFVWNKTTQAVTSRAFLVPDDSRTVLAVLNPSTAFSDKAVVGAPIATINEAMTATIEQVIGASKDNFMMTNATGQLEGDVLDYLQKTEAAAMHAPFRLDVDRVAAKVRVWYDEESVSTRSEMGSLMNPDWDNATWGLNVTNKLFYPISTREQTANHDASGIWSSYGDMGTYRIDPNYDNNLTVGSLGYDDNFNWAGGASGGNTTINFKPFTTGSSGYYDLPEENVEYCLENTFNADNSYHAWTTQAVIKIQLDPFGDNKDFIAIAGEIFDAEELQDLIDNLDEEDDVNVKTHKLGTVNLFFQFLLAQSIADPVNTYSDNIAGAFAVLAAKTTGDWGVASKELNVNFYKAGWSYYKIMIKHDNDDIPTNNLLGEYGVVRNSVYDIKITGLNNPGYPVIPEPDPETPNETDERFLAVRININPWTWYFQKEELE